MNNNIIWEYKSLHDDFSAVLEEVESGLLIFYPKGTIHLKDIKIFFKNLHSYKQNLNQELTLLIDNSNIKSIDLKARLYVVDFVANKTPINKAITFGNNSLMRNFISMFVSIMSRIDLEHKTFGSEKEALEWARSINPNSLNL